MGWDGGTILDRVDAEAVNKWPLYADTMDDKFLGHGEYFQQGKRSVQNLANILVGEYDNVT